MSTPPDTPTPADALTVTRNDDASRYELHRNDDAARYELHRTEDDGAATLLAVLDYRDNGTHVSLTRAFTVPTFRGQGHAATLTAGAVEDIATRGGAAGGTRIVPMCWYVAQWFEDHPEKQELLAQR